MRVDVMEMEKRKFKRYLSEKNVIELMKDGWRLEEKTDYRGKIMSYYLGKKGERTEYALMKITRESLVQKGLIDEHNILLNQDISNPTRSGQKLKDDES